MVALSSTTNTRCPWIEAGAAYFRWAASGAAGANIAVNQNTEPLPSVLSTPVLPPISSTSLRTIDNPSPVPPNLRVVEVSICTNGENKSCRRSAGIPMPVSRTSHFTRVPNSEVSRTLISSDTSPFAVNFTALPARFRSIWRIRPASPLTRPGSFGSICAMTSSPLACA